MEKVRWNRLRLLTMSLIFSAALNIGLIVSLVLSSFEGLKSVFAMVSVESKTGESPANLPLLYSLLNLSFPELVVYLTNREPVEDGYLKRDLALSALCAAHFFDLEKALSATALQKRSIAVSSERKIELYPALSDEQYEAIVRYAYQEKWPLTFEGLFRALKQSSPEGVEESLCAAFFATAEFHSIQTLFQRTGSPVDPYVLLSLLAEAPWEPLRRFLAEQAKLLDLSLDKRRSFLLEYLSYGSSSAASLLLKTDFAFSKSRLQDAGILALLDLLKDSSDLSKRFCLDLLQSPRSDVVREKAADTLSQFFPEEASFTIPSQDPLSGMALKALRTGEHVVQEGDTLWKISRQYKVKLEELVQMNALEKDLLVPGMVLYIP